MEKIKEILLTTSTSYTKAKRLNNAINELYTFASNEISEVCSDKPEQYH